MFKSNSTQATVTRFQTMRVGDTFLDHGGVLIEKIGPTTILVGWGYNAEMSIAAYIDAVYAAVAYGPHLLPADDSATGWIEWGKLFAGRGGK